MKGSVNVEDIVIVGRHAVKEAIISGHAINKILIQDGIKKQPVSYTHLTLPTNREV